MKGKSKVGILGSPDKAQGLDVDAAIEVRMGKIRSFVF
jgi:hypothetical protein